MDSTVEIKYRTSQSVRVTYEPDGTPLFCGRDIAEVLGYKAPPKVTERLASDHSYRRKLTWYDATGRRCGATVLCVDEAGCKAIAERRKEGNRDAYRWVVGDLIREAKLNRPAILPTESPEPRPPKMVAPVAGMPFDVQGFEAKLDAVIAQCVMMKVQISGFQQAAV